MADNTADGAAQRVLALIEGYGIDGEFPYKGEDIRDHIADLRALLDEREQLRERAASATVLHDRWMALLAERDAVRNELRAETAAAKELLHRNVELGTRLDKAEAARDDATARTEQAEAKAMYWQGRAQSAWTDGDRVANDLVAAVFGDGEVREEFRQKWARIAALGDPEIQHRLIGVSGEAHTPTERDLALKAEWLPGVRHEVRDVYPGPWCEAEEGNEPT